MVRLQSSEQTNTLFFGSQKSETSNSLKFGTSPDFFLLTRKNRAGTQVIATGWNRQAIHKVGFCEELHGSDFLLKVCTPGKIWQGLETKKQGGMCHGYLPAHDRDAATG